MSYKVTNTSRSMIHESLGLNDAHGKPVTLILGVRKTAVLTDKQWATPVVQKHISWGRIRAEKLPDESE